MKILVLLALLAVPALAEDCRVLVDGTGCRTRQLAIERIFERMRGVREVMILPRTAVSGANQRIFVIRCEGKAPSLDQFIDALGRRAKFYQIVSVTPASTDGP